MKLETASTIVAELITTRNWLKKRIMEVEESDLDRKEKNFQIKCIALRLVRIEDALEDFQPQR